MLVCICSSFYNILSQIFHYIVMYMIFLKYKINTSVTIHIREMVVQNIFSNIPFNIWALWKYRYTELTIKITSQWFKTHNVLQACRAESSMQLKRWKHDETHEGMSLGSPSSSKSLKLCQKILWFLRWSKDKEHLQPKIKKSHIYETAQIF